MVLKHFPEREEFKKMAKQGNLIPVCLEILADTETPVTAAAKLTRSKKKTAFLFESIEGGEKWARYSFLGNSAKKSLKIYSNAVEIENGSDSQIFEHKGDPISFLREVLSRYRPVSHVLLPRFWGGLIGFVSYEFSSFFEKLPFKINDDELLAHFVVTDNLVVFDNVKHTLILISHVFLNNGDDYDEAYDNALKHIEVMLCDLKKPFDFSFQTSSKPCSLNSLVSFDEFCDSVNKVKEHIQEGDVIQAVISHPFICDNPPDSWLLYRAQRYINPSPYLFYLELGENMLVGSSPETMVRLENGSASLRPIAGTRKRGHNEQEDRRLADELLSDQKERAEHLMLVDLGRNDLGRISETGTVQVTDLMFIERYSHVMHMVSNINCELKTGLDSWDLLKAVFPAGTLSGAPKIRAMEIISSVERRSRGPYGGAVGYISFTGNMDLAITIRTAMIKNNLLTVQAGAGIVADSIPEKEYEETVNKAMAIQKALEMISYGID